MKKRNITLLIIPALLSSCTQAMDLRFVPFNDYEEERILMRDYDSDVFYSKKETTPLIYKNDQQINNIRDLLLVNRSGKERGNIPSFGERKLLVVPLCFNDSPTHNNEALQKEKTIYIQNAFFGEDKRTNYYSVASYYNKASYGQIRLTGEVSPWYEIGINSNNWKSISTSYMNASNIIAERAIDYLKANSDINFDLYDTDKDGNLDGVYFIYDYKFNNDDTNSLFWAYTYYTYKGENGLNKDEPAVNDYSWTSVDTILSDNNKSYSNYLIHETGHLFGLSDYYNTFSSTGEKTNDFHYQPTGCFDMMDYNIGDHSSFSKYLLNWTSPLVVKDNINTTIELKPFSESGEYLLIPSMSYNDSPFGEYLLVEYFAPRGLNKFSGSYVYVDKNGNKGVYNYPQHHGLRIYHVDARLGYFKIGSNSSMIAYIDDPDWESKVGGQAVGLDYAFSNSLTDEQAEQNTPTLIHLLESSGENTFINGVPANNNTLFGFNDDFGINTFKDFTFHAGDKPNFTLKVVTLSTKSAKIEISKLPNTKA